MTRKVTALATILLSMLIILSVAVSSAAAVDPYITVAKSVSPTEIYLKGDGGMPDTATVIMSITGAGDPIPGEETCAPTDVIFVVDDTGSMSDDIAQVKSDITYITDELVAEIPDIRFGLVSYKDSAERDLVLTSSIATFKSKVNALYASGGCDWEEAVKPALVMSYASSWRSGEVAKVIVLIGDAPPHDTPGAVAAAGAACVDDYGIFTNTIACATDPTTTNAFQQIASAGCGTYATKADPADLADAIIDSITTVVPTIDTAGEDVVVTEVVPIHIEASGFNPAPTTSVGDTHTWDFGKVGIGETKTITFDVKCTEAGDGKLVDVYPDTALTYKAWGGNGFSILTTIPFPETCIDCIVSNIPPDVGDARPSMDCLWPPNHRFVDITIEGVTDPDGDPVTITIAGITSDESTSAIDGAGGVTHAPDAFGVGTDTASLRAERSGTGETGAGNTEFGNGRVYELTFVASDGNGGECTSSVTVCVPHDYQRKCDCSCVIDDGQNYDATELN